MMISEKIKKLRHAKGWSQAQLAKKLGVHPQHISRYETGFSNPSAEILMKISEIFEISVDYLLSENTEDVSEYKVKDKQLQRYIEEVDKLNDEDKNLVKGLIEAILIKSKIKDLTSDKKT